MGGLGLRLALHDPDVGQLSALDTAADRDLVPDCVASSGVRLTTVLIGGNGVAGRDQSVKRLVSRHSSRAPTAPGTSSVMTWTYAPANSEAAADRHATAVAGVSTVDNRHAIATKA